MAREYFPHDHHARSELRDLCMKHGMEGCGLYWCLVEILHESGGSFKESDLAAIAYELRVSEELCNSVVREFGLFTVKRGRVSSDRVIRNLQKRTELSAARKAAADARWKPDESRRIIKSVEEWRELYLDKITAFENEATETDLIINSDIWDVKPAISGLFDILENMTEVKVGKRHVEISDYLYTVSFFLGSRSRFDELRSILKDVQDKAKHGRVQNKMNYLLSALFNAAKISGGGEV